MAKGAFSGWPGFESTLCGQQQLFNAPRESPFAYDPNGAPNQLGHCERRKAAGGRT
jgi:hypothetical protein